MNRTPSPAGTSPAWEEPEPFAAELRAASKAVHSTCFPCHTTVKARDFVFNRTLIGERLMVNVTCNKLTAVPVTAATLDLARMLGELDDR